MSAFYVLSETLSRTDKSQGKARACGKPKVGWNWRVSMGGEGLESDDALIRPQYLERILGNNLLRSLSPSWLSLIKAARVSSRVFPIQDS
jgi:hypothetical protein